MKTRAAFVVSRYGGRLSLACRCDPYLFRDEDTADLVGLFVNRLRHTIEHTAPPVPPLAVPGVRALADAD